MKILLVDDDPAIIQALLQLLKRNGFDTKVACNGAFALRNAALAEGIDLLITDVVMEPMDGFTLQQQLRQSYPALKTIFISGYDLSEYTAQTEGSIVLSKPFDAEKLLAAIAETMGPDGQPVVDYAPAAETSEGTEAAAENAPVAACIGNYQVIRKIGEGRWGPVFLAVQTSMGRPVAMKVLANEIEQKDPEAKQRFLATARAQASVKHASILSVFEAGEADGQTYYTYEYVEGVNLEELKARGKKIDDPLALRILKVVAEGLSYLEQQGIPHVELAARRIYIDKNGGPRLANPAINGKAEGDLHGDIVALARIVALLLPNAVATDAGLKLMLTKMAMEGSAAYPSWNAVEQAAKALEPKIIPADAIKLTAQEHAAIRAVEEAKRQQNRSLMWSAAGIFGLLWVAAGVLWWGFRSNERPLDQMVDIPAGEFIYQDGQKATTGEFWIDQYEVTIGQYARFLAALEANPTTEFDSPDQPKGKSHIPKDNTEWQIYYGRARAGKPVRGVLPIDLNCPIFNVDYWDAYAYAKWAGKRLPTEKEWEKAGRGVNGFQYPWGNTFDPKLVNSGADYVERPGRDSAAKSDGYLWWAPVDAIKGDKSPFGVMGMAGNVAEWTGSWDAAHKHPVIRGGSFHSSNPANAASDVKITHRFADADPEAFYEFLGFRCVSDHPPKK